MLNRKHCKNYVHVVSTPYKRTLMRAFKRVSATSFLGVNFKANPLIATFLSVALSDCRLSVTFVSFA